MKKILLLLIIITSFNLNGQNESCDGTRFIDDIFTSVDTTFAIQFGSNTTIFGNDTDLFFDVYEPADDDAENRPVMIMAFGGSFIQGNRADVGFLCEAYARKGYVAVSIDYRLYDGPLFPPPSAIQMTEVVVKAVADMKGAIRYLRQDADNDNTWRIDPDMIFVGGISAGAIAACHTATLDSTDSFTPELEAIIAADGGLEGTTNEIDYSSEVQGYINFSGGLADASWMDAEDPPFYSCHDEFDGTVPYGKGFASVFGIDIIYMEGSQILKEKGDSLGIRNKLKTIEFSPIHVSYFAIATNAVAVIDESALFTSHSVCNTISSTVESDIDNQILYPNPSTGIINLKSQNQLGKDVSVYDLAGQLMITQDNTIQINLSDLKPGGYIIKVTDKSSGSIQSQMITLHR